MNPFEPNTLFPDPAYYFDAETCTVGMQANVLKNKVDDENKSKYDGKATLIEVEKKPIYSTKEDLFYKRKGYSISLNDAVMITLGISVIYLLYKTTNAVTNE